MANIVTKWLGDRFLLWKDLGAVGPAGETVHAPVQASVNVKADGTEVGTAASPLYIGPATGVIFGGVTPFSIAGTFTRPADTTQYAVGAQVANSTSTPTANAIVVARVNAGGVWINNIRLTSSNPAAAAGSFRVHFFNATFTPQNDNAAFGPSDAERLTEIMSIDLDMAEYSANNYVYKPSAPWPKYVVCAAATKSIWWTVEARNAYVPSNGEVFGLLLQGQQD